MESSSLFLVFGKGLIGGELASLLEKKYEKFVVATSRMENREAILKEIEEIRPTHVLLAAGAVGTPNVDWCEDHQIETLRANVIGTLNLIDVCYLKNVHVTYFSTGCIYNYDENHSQRNGIGFTEEDPPNYTGSFYSKTKLISEDAAKAYPNVLILRLRLPVLADLVNEPRNLVLKLVKYNKLTSFPNSVTILPELLPFSIEMAKKKKTGIYNFTNPGSLSNNEIMELYRQYVDPDFRWENFSLEEQATILKAQRCNAILDVGKLQKEFPFMLSAKESIVKYVFEPAVKHKEEIKDAVRKRKRNAADPVKEKS